jgi:hypothetical protein
MCEKYSRREGVLKFAIFVNSVLSKSIHLKIAFQVSNLEFDDEPNPKALLQPFFFSAGIPAPTVTTKN